MPDPKAAEQARLDALTCPKCHAMNRPGVRYINVDEDGTCQCLVCAAVFSVRR